MKAVRKPRVVWQVDQMSEQTAKDYNDAMKKLTSPNTARKPFIPLASVRVASFANTSSSALICSFTMDSIFLNSSGFTGLPVQISAAFTNNVVCKINKYKNKAYHEKNQILISQEEQWIPSGRHDFQEFPAFMLQSIQRTNKTTNQLRKQ